MRDLGYSLETAVADLIDNSISAEASHMDIVCQLAGDQPFLAILDDGHGMTGDQLLRAMKHGSANPRDKRKANDLGRFGLGLKTASFSQCRRLTLVSQRDGERSGAEWNLDLIDERDDWVLLILDPEEIDAVPLADRLPGRGTLVVWRELDRLFEEESGVRRDEIVNDKLDVLERHLSLVFHRYLAGEIKGRRKVRITLNGHPVEPFDPFCRKNPAHQELPEDIVRIGNAAVHLQPYILPHHSKLSAAEYDYYQGRSDFISNQGAYIYRNGRLMAWGDWFRLVSKGEATKLARVQIDFPNSLDESWTIDIKKSRARPPHAVRERLRQIINRIVGRSTTVHRGRGQRLFDEVEAPIWERYADQSGIRYAVNRSHPLAAKLAERIGQDLSRHLQMLLEAIAASLPVEMIYSDYSLRPREVAQGQVDERDVLDRLKALKAAFSDDETLRAEEFLEIVRSTRVFDSRMEMVDRFISEEFP